MSDTQLGHLSIDLEGPGALDLGTYLKALTIWHQLIRQVAENAEPDARFEFEIVEMRPRGATVKACAYPRKRRRKKVIS